MEADPARAWTIGEIALACGVRRRTLQRQFGHFIGRTPMAFLRDLRFERARRELLRASGRMSVTDIAGSCGFNHFGRFAAQYRARYGETPSASLSRQLNFLAGGTRRLPPLPMAVERPAIAVLPFALVGPDTWRADGLAEEIVAALIRLRWITVTLPDRARYHLRGRISRDEAGRLRICVILIDAATGRYLWADRWDGDGKDLFGFEERVALRVATAIQPSLREAEIDRAWRQDPARLNAWELTMRALPRVSSGEPAAEGLALELLERAIEQAPSDPLPMALAAFCHGLRGCHNFCRRPDEERAVARVLAARAAQLTTGDALTESLLAAGYTLAHDLTTAAIHADKALAFDGGSSWAWGRSGWIKAYRGEAEEAIERFQIARALAPSDRINFLWDVGIASGHFDAARYDESARWCERALVENPAAVSINKTMASAFALAGRKDDARRSVAELGRAFPDLTVAQIRSGLPFRAAHLDRMAEGLGGAGMRRG